MTKCAPVHREVIEVPISRRKFEYSRDGLERCTVYQTVVSRKILTDESACLMCMYLVMVVAPLLLLLLLWLLLLLSISRLLRLDIVPDLASPFNVSASRNYHPFTRRLRVVV